MHRIALITLFSVATATTALAAIPPPPGPPWTAVDWPTSLAKKPTSGITLGKMRLRFEETTLEQVARVVSLGKIARRGDAGDSVAWLCYTLNGTGKRQRLWITSNEMGGNTLVTGISARIVVGAKPSEDCPLLPRTFNPVSLDMPLWLGTSDESLRQILGAPSHAQDGWREYDFHATIRDDGKCEGGYDFISALITKSEHGRVIALDAGQVTSC